MLNRPTGQTRPPFPVLHDLPTLPPTPSFCTGSGGSAALHHPNVTCTDRAPCMGVPGLLSPSLPLPATTALPRSATANPASKRVQHALALIGRLPDAHLVATMLQQLTSGPCGELAQFAAHSPRAAHLALWTAETVMRGLCESAKAEQDAPLLCSAEVMQRGAQRQATHRGYKTFFVQTAPSFFAQQSVDAFYAATGLRPSGQDINGAIDEQGLTEAATSARHALTLGSEAPAAAAVLAWIHLHRNEEVQAEQVLQLAALRSPQDVTLHVMLGACALRLGRASDAAAALGVAVGLAPNDVTAHTYLGNALALTGEHFCAMGHYIHAVMQACGAKEAQQNLVTMQAHLARGKTTVAPESQQN